jgi:hypothetical protein
MLVSSSIQIEVGLREFKLDFGMPSQLPGWQGTLGWQRLGPIRARSGGWFGRWHGY